MYDDDKRIRSRAEAGRQLALLLSEWRDRKPVVFGMSRGGVPVARELAGAIHAPFHVIVVRRIAVPTGPNLALGAIAEGDGKYLNTQLQMVAGINERELAESLRRESAEVSRLVALYRGGAPLPKLDGATAIIVDDGLVTGTAIRAAIDAVRKLSPGRVIVAAGVGARQTVESLRKSVDGIVCAMEPARVMSLSHYYQDFRPVSDQDVLSALKSS